MIKALSSVRITVVCLFLLFVLTFWGTVAQMHQGLYAAQERFFASFFFLAAGFIPFPGAQGVLWVLFVNLLCAAVEYFSKYRQWRYAGIKIIHFGLLLYFASAFFIFHLSRESVIRLAEGEETNVSYSYTDWEIAYWKETGKKRQVTAFDTKFLKPGYQIPFENKNFSIKVKQFYTNSDAFNSANQKPAMVISLDDISLIKPKDLEKEREKNIAGGVFDINFDGKPHTLLLYGAIADSTPVSIGDQVYYFVLRHKSYPLPFAVKLDQFKANFYPGTNMAKSYESYVTMSTGTLQRQVKIFMNNPLRHNDYTVYQASYDTDNAGRQHSTLAVVQNSARILPYVSCLLVFFGLALHFLIQAFVSKAKS